MSPFITGVLGMGIVYLLIHLIFRAAPKAALNSAFVKLGDMKGMSREEITKAVGAPKGITHHDDGSKTVIWSAGGYHMALLFDKDDKVVKIQTEVL